MWVFKCFENFTEIETQQYYNLKESETEQRSLDL